MTVFWFFRERRTFEAGVSLLVSFLQDWEQLTTTLVRFALKKAEVFGEYFFPTSHLYTHGQAMQLDIHVGSLALKVAYVAGCLALGLSFLEDWEECRIDKVHDEIVLQRGKVYQKLLGLQKIRNLLVQSTNVMNVRVHIVEKGTNQKPTLFAIVLILKTGLSVPIAEAAKSSNSSELHLLAEKIRMFLKLSRIETLNEDVDSDSYYHSYEDSSSDSEEEIEAPCGRLRETIALIHEAR